MTRRKPYRSPDGKDWRDPNMPVIVNSKSEGWTEWAPERLSRVAGFLVEASEAPHYTNDPSYNWKRKP